MLRQRPRESLLKITQRLDEAVKKVVETEVYGSPQLPRSASLAYCLARSASPSRDHREIGTNHDRYIVKKKRGEGSLVRSNAIAWSTATRTGGLVKAIPQKNASSFLEL